MVSADPIAEPSTKQHRGKGKGKGKAKDTDASDLPTTEPDTVKPTTETKHSKRKRDEGIVEDAEEPVVNVKKEKGDHRPKRHKLAPPRPFPSVPTSSNATGPRSARADGNNQILVTRKMPLGGYLRRCKECVVKQGYKTIHLSAMTAAIPQLLLLVTSFPETLPYPRSEIRMEYKTGTVKSMDEILPDDDEEDDDTFGELIERKSSSLSVTIVIGDGSRDITGNEKKQRKKGKGQNITRPAPVVAGDAAEDDEMSTGDDDD